MVFSPDDAMSDLEEMMRVMGGPTTRESAARTMLSDCDFYRRVLPDKDLVRVFIAGDGNGNPTAVPGLVRTMLEEYTRGTIDYAEASQRLDEIHEGYRRTFTDARSSPEEPPPTGRKRYKAASSVGE